ncbi:SWIB/MDM2 domain-containing protein [Aureococcus anophagefferens]|nr:SWIB/MDM2 domain-containing protein [Aureococcus anophagefferens]
MRIRGRSSSGRAPPYYANAAIRPVKLLCDASACACPGAASSTRARTSTASVSLGGGAWALRACDTCGQKARHERCGGGGNWTCRDCGGEEPESAPAARGLVDSAASIPPRGLADDEEDPRHPVLSDAMAAVVGVGRANHFRLVKLLWKYIKKHDLQNPANKNEIVCDAALKAAFKKDKVTSFGMSKLLSAHMHREHDSFLARAPVVDYAELERSDVDESDAEDVAGAVEDTPRTRRAFSELADYLAAKGLSRGVVTNWSVTTNQRGDAIFLDPAGRIFRSKAEVARFAKAAADAEDRAADDRRVEAARPPPVVEAAPPAADAEGLLFEGDAIEARCRGGAWYPGRVAFVHDGGGAIDVAYDDGSGGACAGVRAPFAGAAAARSGLAGASAAALAPGAKVEIYWDGDDAFYAGTDIARARASVKYFDQAWGSTHDGEPCPPARYAGWSVVLTGVASEPTKFVDGAGFVYRTKSDAARAMGALAGRPSESSMRSLAVAAAAAASPPLASHPLDAIALAAQRFGLSLPAPAAARLPRRPARRGAPGPPAPCVVAAEQLAAAVARAERAEAQVAERDETIRGLRDTIHGHERTIRERADRRALEARAPAASARPPPRGSGAILDLEAELHDDNAEEQAVGRSLKQLARHLPLFVGSDDVAGARAGTVQFFDRVYATTHDGEPCPPARYAGWSVVLTRTASKPTRFVDGAGAVYKSRSEAAHAMGILAGQPSELAPVDQKWAETPYGDRRALLFEPGAGSAATVVGAAEAPPALELEVADEEEPAAPAAEAPPAPPAPPPDECASRGFAEPRAEHASRDAAFERRHGLDLGVSAPALKRYAVAVEAGYALPDKPRYRAAAEAAGAVWIRKAGLEADRELLELSGGRRRRRGPAHAPEDFPWPSSAARTPRTSSRARSGPSRAGGRSGRARARGRDAAEAQGGARRRSSKPGVVDLAASQKKRKVDPEVLAPVLLRRGWTAVSTNGHSRWVDPTGATFGTLAAILRAHPELEGARA